MSSIVYADYNATTPLDPDVFEAMRPYLSVQFGNPSSSHAYGRQAALAVERARGQVADLIGARSGEILFTSGGTESNNLAVLCAADGPGRIVLTGVEHPSVHEPAQELVRRGWNAEELAMDTRGAVDLGHAEELLGRPADLVCCMLAQNETGVLQPVAEVAKLARAASPQVRIHCDAAQAAGKVPVDVEALDVDLLTVVGHKLYGPKGIGALYVRSGALRRPLMFGGGQEAGIRPGTEAVAAIVGLGAACERAGRVLGEETERLTRLRERLWAHLSARLPGVQRTGEGADTLPNTLHLCFPRCDATDLLAAASEVAASTGSACQSRGHGAGRVLEAMGWSPSRARGALRLSLGRFTTEAEVDRIALALSEAQLKVAGED